MMRREDGLSLATVLILLLMVSTVAGAFVWRTNANQRQIGRAQQATAALYLAEAGAEKALWLIARGGVAPSPGSGEGSVEGYEEATGSGRFVIEKLAQQPDDVIELITMGEANGEVRRLRVTVRLVPKALGFGLFAGNVAALVRQARLYVVPVLKAKGKLERFGDIGVARHLWVEEGVTLNRLDGQEVTLRDGRVRDYALFGLASAIGADTYERERLPDLVATGEAQLTYGRDADPLYALSDLGFKYGGVKVRALRTESASMPAVDLDVYRAWARENHGNQALNKAVGERRRDRALSEKRDSQYTQEQFEQILSHLDLENRTRRGGDELGLTGIVFVEGAVKISGMLRIEDGAMVVKGSVWVADQARLEIRHSPAITTMPGLVAFHDSGKIRLSQDAVVIVDGIVLAQTGLEVFNASLDVAGAILTGQGFLNDGGTVVVRYQPAVLGTAGLTRGGDVLVRPLSWHEVR